MYFFAAQQRLNILISEEIEVYLLIDVVIVLVAVLTVWIYTHRGFVKSVIGLVKYGVSFALAYFVGPLLGTQIHEAFMHEKLSAAVKSWLSDQISNAGDEIDCINNLIRSLPDYINKVFNNFGISAIDISEKYGDNPISEASLSEISSEIAGPISSFLSNSIAYILIFIASLVVLSILSILLDAIFKLPVLKTLNKALGFSLGIICAVLNVLIIVSIMNIAFNLVGARYPLLSIEAVNDKTFLLGFINSLDIFHWLF